jgi:hypothetical protein
VIVNDELNDWGWSEQTIGLGGYHGRCQERVILSNLTTPTGREALAVATATGIAFPERLPEALTAATIRRLPTRLPMYEKKKFLTS